MSEMRLVPVEPTDKELHSFGYAPGNYLSKCRFCGQAKDGLDKLASCCEPCARTRYKRLVAEWGCEALSRSTAGDDGPPREPTDAMVDAAELKMPGLSRLQIRFLYETMVAANQSTGGKT